MSKYANATTVDGVTKDAVRVVTSNQTGPHDNLPDMVRRHQQHVYQKPVAEHTRVAFGKVAAIIAERQQPIILDSGCGTALSTRCIAEKYPDSLVIGIDRSEVRLGKRYEDRLPDNALTVRADLIDFWMLAAEAGWRLQRHFVLYPNPYPKSVHLKRRWHAHAVFPTLLKLGGELELRTNWGIYAEEFALALRLSGYSGAVVERFLPDEAGGYWTLFEKKYAEAGQVLYRCRVGLA